jgi:hypothetical protein
MSRVSLPLSLVRRTAAAAAGLAVVGVLTHPSAATAATASPGRVCMFSAPNEVGGAGHVAWAFRTGADRWTWGSFSSKGKTGASNWTWAAVRAYFAAPGRRYASFRCKDTHGMQSTAATQTWKKFGVYGKFDGAVHNCLTAGIAVFRAYTPELRSLPSGVGWGPKYYYTKALPQYGFAGMWPLR